MDTQDNLLAGGTVGPPGGASPEVYAKSPKSPALAVFLSLVLAGMGQVYNGHIAKAFVFFFGFVSCVWGLVDGEVFPFVFLIPFVYLAGVIDAHRSATAINATAQGRPPGEAACAAESPGWGAGLIVLGLMLLANTLGWLRFETYHRFWPLLVILAGGYLLYASLAGPRNPEPRP